MRRPGHTTVVAYLALFIAIAGGTAVAAKKIGADKLKKNAVTTKKIASSAVTTGKIANDAVTGGKLANGSVKEGKIDSDAVTANKLAQSSVGTNKIRDEAVESAKLASGAVTEGKIGNDAVVGSKVAPGSLDLTDVARAIIDVNVAVTAPFNSGTCQMQPVSHGSVAGGDYPLALQGVPAAEPLLQVAGISSPGAGQLNVLLCNYSGVNVNTPAPIPVRVALLR